jgi:hypothetical protein
MQAMRDLAAETIRFLIVVALILLAAMTLAKPAVTPLLIDAAMPAKCPNWFVQHPCALAKCGSPASRTA